MASKEYIQLLSRKYIYGKIIYIVLIRGSTNLLNCNLKIGNNKPFWFYKNKVKACIVNLTADLAV